MREGGKGGWEKERREGREGVRERGVKGERREGREEGIDDCKLS